MKIYFEDGFLRKDNQLPFKADFYIDAQYGVTASIDFLDKIKEREYKSIVYTNSIFAFSNEYAWNEELQVPEIYIRAGKHMIFTRIDELTDRELRKAHNLAKMFVNGGFN